ncbi:MAG: hypothetical protein Fur0010_16470 [Bdellovibrio sp.]
MKIKLLMLALLVSENVFAGILNSDYEVRHLKLIEKAIEVKCGSFWRLSQIESSEEVIQVDQGIRDIIFKTKINAIDRIDQGVFDEYEVNVESEFADMYDHANQEWGVYSVRLVNCKML